MGRVERQNQRRLRAVESFFEKDVRMTNIDGVKEFMDVFSSYKAVTKTDNVYILDELTPDQKVLFIKKYSHTHNGASTLYSERYCNDDKYRRHFFFVREDENINLVLFNVDDIMRASVVAGKESLYSKGNSNNWDCINDTMVIDFNGSDTYKSFTQKKNHLLIDTVRGMVDIELHGNIQNLEFKSYNQSKLILKIV